jgi:serine/threonine protein kinase
MESLVLEANRRAKLGEGGFAEVFLYCSPSASTAPIAAKTAKRKELQHRLVNEYHLLQYIHQAFANETKYRAIVTPLALVFTPSTHLCMEAVLGGALHRHIKYHKSLSLETVRIYSSQLVSALLHLASLNCVHRDIKANNVLLTQHGHIKLCDFGQAIVLNYREDHTTLSGRNRNKLRSTKSAKAYTLSGALHSMAPEMAAGSFGYDCKADWWSLGVLLYEMMTGEPPRFYRGVQPAHWPSISDQVLIREVLSRTSGQEEDEAYRMSWSFQAVSTLVLETSSSKEQYEGQDLEALLRRHQQQQDYTMQQQAMSFISQLLSVHPNNRLGMHNADDSAGPCELAAQAWLLRESSWSWVESGFQASLGSTDLLPATAAVATSGDDRDLSVEEQALFTDF